MTTTTALTGAAIAEGLRALADVFEQDTDITERENPDQAVDITVHMASEDRVRALAARYGAPVTDRPAAIWTVIPLGPPREPSYGIAAYAGSITVTVYGPQREVTR